MADKKDNPEDHEHGAYWWADFFSFVWLLALTVAVVVGWGLNGDSLGQRDDRMDSIECRLAPDEIQCLRELLK